ncbi:transcriptional regulator [Streptomyces sp. LP05-1]|uniref:Transcriptional regulator n=1 Tax=Streptomyces pyxinae TaxID=2970734 RepID=A0ABT2CC61_9ACTN|nr:transcriptional regulator [Streptomyces sp. LP05-1]MCS0634905.1 transcriptional regulator [Streptomyces sp. LP05-1]
MTTRQAGDVLKSAAAELAPRQGANPLVASLAAGTASRKVIGALALEQRHIIPSDRRSFGYLADRSAGHPRAAELFGTLAEGEDVAFRRLGALLAGCGLDEAAAEAYEPRAGCQTYPAYVAWLALNGEPADVALAVFANFSAWGGYCATIASAMRARYGFADEECGFFDFFALPAPALEELAVAAVQEGLDRGLLTAAGHRYGRLLQTYELMFWDTLAT